MFGNVLNSESRVSLTRSDLFPDVQSFSWFCASVSLAFPQEAVIQLLSAPCSGHISPSPFPHELHELALNWSILPFPYPEKLKIFFFHGKAFSYFLSIIKNSSILSQFFCLILAVISSSSNMLLFLIFIINNNVEK